MKKVLLLGSGAREHAIGEALKKGGAQVFVYGKTRNPGLVEIAENYELGGLTDSAEDFAHMREYARRVAPDFAFIGPDDPIGVGVADLLLELGLHSVAPLKTVARLESSKSFTRDLLAKYGIPGNPQFKVFYEENSGQEMENFLDMLGDDYVVKADVLMGGKGVKVSGEHLKNHAEALAYARECVAKAGRVVIEEKFIGQEFSLMSFVDGMTTVEMPAVQDHKRAFEGDIGPNTGGMGSYSDANHLLPFLRTEDIEEARAITRQVHEALFQETGVRYRGIMYGGFIATAEGVRLIEYNARFGDPEVLNVLPLLQTNFVDVCEAIIAGQLSTMKIDFARQATICKYIVPEGYPDHPVKGATIQMGKIPAGVKMYYAAVERADGFVQKNEQRNELKDRSKNESTSSVDSAHTGKIGTFQLGTSRSIALVGLAETLNEAQALAENACEAVEGPVFHRRDIGTTALIAKRVDMMKNLRS